MDETITKNRDVDYDSFINTDLELRNSKFRFDGFARLESAQIKHTSEIETSKELEHDEYIVIDCNISHHDNSYIIIPPYKSEQEYQFLLEWTGSDNISDLCGQKIPVENISKNIYKPSSNIMDYNVGNIEYVKEMVGIYINYDPKSGEWKKSDDYELLMNLGTLICLFTGYILTIPVIFHLSLDIIFSFIAISVLGFILSLIIAYIDHTCLYIYKITDKLINLFK